MNKLNRLDKPIHEKWNQLGQYITQHFGTTLTVPYSLTVGELSMTICSVTMYY